jgi:hypothetical protein
MGGRARVASPCSQGLHFSPVLLGPQVANRRDSSAINTRADKQGSAGAEPRNLGLSRSWTSRVGLALGWCCPSVLQVDRVQCEGEELQAN